MPLEPVKIPLYPDVPRAEGVPAVSRSPLEVIFTELLLEADVLTAASMFEPPQWGIFFTSGQPLVIPDTVISVDFRREARISDYPVEEGGFQSYDKVRLPYDIRLRMSCSGANMNKVLFLENLDHAHQSLDLFQVVTPDAIYSNVNITHYDYRRERMRGATILHVEVWLQQVISTATTSFTSTKQSTGATDVNNGTVQPIDPPVGMAAPPIPPLSPAAPPTA